MHTATIGDVATSGSTDVTATINQQLYAEFGSHLKTTRELLSYAIEKNKSGEYIEKMQYCNEQAVLMGAMEVFGKRYRGIENTDIESDDCQLPVFMDKRFANNRSSWYWLKDIASASLFCCCYYDGYAIYGFASDADSYVRPRFVIS